MSRPVPDLTVLGGVWAGSIFEGTVAVHHFDHTDIKRLAALLRKNFPGARVMVWNTRVGEQIEVIDIPIPDVLYYLAEADVSCDWVYTGCSTQIIIRDIRERDGGLIHREVHEQ